MTLRRSPVGLLSAVLLLLATPRVARSAPPSLDDIVDLVQVSAPQVAPDGSRVLYTRTTLAPWKSRISPLTTATGIWPRTSCGSFPRQAEHPV